MINRRILITGAGGYIGSELVNRLLAEGATRIIATDIRPFNKVDTEIIRYMKLDIRDKDLVNILNQEKINSIVHLASIVTPGKEANREFEYSVDVLGTQNILDCALASQVEQIILTSSGAAYGYYADNPEWLDENDRIRGNDEFAYSCHKRLVEEMLLKYRQDHPKLKQLIFRPGTVLGKNVNNQITNLFKKPVIMGIKGAATPFVFIWDQDVVECLLKGIRDNSQGIYNLAGDGYLTMKQIASILRKPYVEIPESVLKGALFGLKKVHLTQYGPEQIIFLKFRPVLSNQRLKAEFKYTPQKTSKETFMYYLSEGQSI
jgi:UDP-glucose 4-epimerase